MEETLRRLAARLPDAATDAVSASEESIDTIAVLRDLARVAPGAPDAERRAWLDALMRKVHVAKRVDAHYDGRWRRRDGAAPLPAEAWPLLVAVLLAHATPARPDAEDERGFALKCLNAACAALELAGEGVGEREGLEARAEALLAALAAGPGA